MEHISIFARPSYLGNHYPRHFKEEYTIRLGPQIRGFDIAEYLGAKINPTKGWEDDLCIYVKPKHLNRVRDGDWVDTSDGNWLLEALKTRPGIKVIAHSKISYRYYKEKLKNEIVYLPQQHLNWENIKRDRKEITTAGYIGSPSPLSIKIYNEIENRLKESGFDFITCFNYQSRQDAVNFYKKIDLLVIGVWEPEDHGLYKTPTKMINAASFGVPSIAYPMIGYEEFEGYYIRINNNDEIVVEAEKFKDKDYYNKWSKKIIKKADEYHISKIAQRYNNLLLVK